MSTLTVPFTFTGGTDAVAAQVNSNFSTLFGWVNTNAIWADGSRAFTGIPSGPSADPTSNNQFTRKLYVDQRVINQGNPGDINNNGIMKWGSQAISFSGGGANFSFPTAFPNVCQAAVATSADDSLIVNVLQISSRGVIALRCVSVNTGALHSGSVGVNWFAGGY